MKKEENFCPGCNAILDSQKSFNPDADYNVCEECGETLFNPSIYSGEKFPGVYWFCDKCGALLSKQTNFNDKHGIWHCSECGFKNYIDEKHI